MAGLGRKVFTAGDVLTASDVQNYLMDQTVMNFAGTAARSSAIATPTTGMTTYNQTTQQLETYNGSAYIGMSGLQLVKKQIIGTAVASVQVTSAFSATYENYKIIISGGVGSTSADLQLSLDGITTGYYSCLTYQPFSSTSVIGAAANNAARWSWTGAGSTAALTMNLDLIAPNLAKPKIANAIYNELGTTATNGISRQYNASTTQATGLTVTPSGGTLTGGTIYVYGYGT
jgi:hypothetical protein